jgi:hypothetical protein
VTLTAKDARTAQNALSARPGREIRSKSGSHRLVLMTETSEALDEVRQQLLQTPGVETVDPIASFDDEDPGLALLRWNTGGSADVARPFCADATCAAAPVARPGGTSIARSDRPAAPPSGNEARSLEGEAP